MTTPDIIHNDVINKITGYSGYVTATKTVGKELHIQMMLCEKPNGKPVDWFKRMWYPSTHVDVKDTKLFHEKAISESK